MMMRVYKGQSEKGLSIYDLSDEIDMFLWEKGVCEFFIMERFNDKTFVYTLNDLHVDIEDEEIYCWDHDNRILNDNRYLTMFLKDNIIYIMKYIDYNKIVIEIELRNGYIKIEMAI